MRTGWTIIVLTVLGLLTVVITIDPTTVVTGTAVAVGTADGDRQLVSAYFDELNDAGRDGTATQRDFLRRTQHPEFIDRLCDLGDLTLRIQPAMSTFRPDPTWLPEKATTPPSGLVYVLGVSVSIRRDGSPIAEQIGSQRVVVLDGRTYGFTPCPTR